MKLSEKRMEGLEKLVNRHDIMLFMKGTPKYPECGFSKQLVEILKNCKSCQVTFPLRAKRAAHHIRFKVSKFPDASKAKKSMIRGADFKYFDILSDEKVREGLKVYSDWPTYPQLYVKGELIGGLDIVKQLEKTGELENTLFPKISSPLHPSAESS